MIYLPITELEKMPHFRNQIYRAPNGTLYKISRECTTKQRREFFEFMCTIPKINGLLYPIDLLCHKNIYGYQMEEVLKCSNVDEYLNSQSFSIDILKTIYLISSILQTIHQYFIFGDVRNANILLTSNDVCFIDWDCGLIGSSENLETYYNVVIGNNILNESSKLTDTIKAFITSLSIYYRINLEALLCNRDIRLLLHILKQIKADNNIINYLEYLIEQLLNNQKDVEVPFADLVEHIDLPKEEEISELKRICNI